MSTIPYIDDPVPRPDGQTGSSHPPSGNHRIEFATQPDRYRHWKLSIDGRIATLSMDVQEDAPLVPGYKLKLNSYDLGVDIELYDAVQRLRFEHPAVATVVLTSASPSSFVPEPIFVCWPSLPTRIRSTSANSPMKPATALKTPAHTPAKPMCAP